MLALKRAVFGSRSRDNLSLLFGLLGEKYGLDVGEDTTLSDGDSREKLVQLFVITDGELEMSGDDSRLLVVPGGVTGQLEDLSGEVLKDGSQVDWGTRPETGGVLSSLQVSADSSDWELKSCLGGLGHGLLSGLSFSSSRHDVVVVIKFRFRTCARVNTTL